MAQCGCTQGCNCFVSEDGWAAGHAELGRNFTQVEGNGSSSNPFVIHFLDSDAFRPRTAEILIDSQTFQSDPSASVERITNPGSFIYESPLSFIVINATPGIHYVAATYYMIGASVTFAETTDSTTNTQRALLLEGDRLGGIAYAFGGQTIPGLSTDPLTLTVQGFSASIFTGVPGLPTIVNAFALSVSQSSGSPILVSNIRVWITQI